MLVEDSKTRTPSKKERHGSHVPMCLLHAMSRAQSAAS